VHLEVILVDVDPVVVGSIFSRSPPEDAPTQASAGFADPSAPSHASGPAAISRDSATDIERRTCRERLDPGKTLVRILQHLQGMMCRWRTSTRRGQPVA
jgi:hypothetical protein